VGHLVADVSGLSAETDKPRIQAILSQWMKNGALVTEYRKMRNSSMSPYVVAGRPVDPSDPSVAPHLERYGGESGESVDGGPF